MSTIGVVPVQAERTEVSYNDSFPYITGGVATNSIKDIYVDKEDGFYINGTYRSDADFDPGVGVGSRQTLDDDAGFVTLIDATGEDVRTLDYANFDHDTYVHDIAFDSGNKLFVAGGFEGDMDFDLSVSIFR